MARRLTLRQAADAFRRYSAGVPAVVVRTLDRTMNVALRLSVTKYMQGLGTGKNAQPPNPPPGPLGIRTGAGRRSVRRLPAAKTAGGYSAGLATDLRYMAVHEGREDGRPTRVQHPGSSKFQSWIGPDGRRVATMRTRPHAIRIPARPFMLPALREASKSFAGDLDRALRELEDRIL